MRDFAKDASVVGVKPQPFLGIHAVNVFVRDHDQSLRFYVEQLGFDVAFDGRLQSGDRLLAVAPPDGSAVLALIAPPPHSKQHQLIGRATGIVFVAEDVIAKFEEWRMRGVRFLNTPRLRRVKYERHSMEGTAEAAEQSVWGGIFTRFEDVDGNSFALVGYDEVNRTIEAQRGWLPKSWNQNVASHKNWKLQSKCRPDFSRNDCRPCKPSNTRAFASRLIR
jgi:catechol 2,3-dioxygenase-like lactoylglutathione lyase family enzyme